MKLWTEKTQHLLTFLLQYLFRVINESLIISKWVKNENTLWYLAKKCSKTLPVKYFSTKSLWFQGFFFKIYENEKALWELGTFSNAKFFTWSDTIGIDFFLNGLHLQYAIHLHLLRPKKWHFLNALFLKAF